ncbi:MAG: hypothetical protein RIQ33_2094 [Bacteroidota bacterium]|jgi:hypothetical protein
MTKQIFTVLAASAISATMLFTSCKKEIDASFTKSFDGVNFTLDSTSHTGAISLSGVDVSTGITQLAADKGFDINKIKKVVLKSCTITINDSIGTPSITFDVLDSVQATLSGTSLSTLKVGSANPIAHNGSTSLTLSMNNVDVAPYVKADKFNFNVSGANNAAIPHKVPMTAKLNFEITATIVK